MDDIEELTGELERRLQQLDAIAEPSRSRVWARIDARRAVERRRRRARLRWATGLVAGVVALVVVGGVHLRTPLDGADGPDGAGADAVVAAGFEAIRDGEDAGIEAFVSYLIGAAQAGAR